MSHLHVDVTALHLRTVTDIWYFQTLWHLRLFKINIDNNSYDSQPLFYQSVCIYMIYLANESIYDVIFYFISNSNKISYIQTRLPLFYSEFGFYAFQIFMACKPLVFNHIYSIILVQFKALFSSIRFTFPFWLYLCWEWGSGIYVSVRLVFVHFRL